MNVAGDGRGNLRGMRQNFARRLATNNIIKSVFLIPEDGTTTEACLDIVKDAVEEEFGLDVVLEDQPADAIFIDELTECNQTFIDQSLMQSRFIFLDDNEEPTHFCVEKLLDRYNENEKVVLAITSLEVGSCDQQDINELLYEIDESLFKEERFYTLVEEIFEHYGCNDEVPQEESRDYWYKKWRSRRSWHRKQHHKV